MKSIIIKLLAVQLGRELFSSVSGRVFARPTCDLLDALHDFPIIILEVDSFCIALLGCKFPLQFLTCHDHTTKLYYTTASFKRFSSRHWIWSSLWSLP